MPVVKDVVSLASFGRLIPGKLAVFLGTLDAIGLIIARPFLPFDWCRYLSAVALTGSLWSVTRIWADAVSCMSGYPNGARLI